MNKIYTEKTISNQFFCYIDFNAQYFIKKKMRCCTAINCMNRADKGFRLFTFPANNNRRSIWIQKMQRNNCKQSAYSRLCQVCIILFTKHNTYILCIVIDV